MDAKQLALSTPALRRCPSVFDGTLEEFADEGKLPRLVDNSKVELSGIFPPAGSHEEVKVKRVADCCRAQAG